MKIGIIGGSGVYTPLLINEIVSLNDYLDVDLIVLNGRSIEKLNEVKTVCEQLAKRSGQNISIYATTDRIEAISNVDIIICQIRVGGLEARAFDEEFPSKFGIVGEETVGPGGLANAMRTIPVVLQIASEVEEYNKNANLIVLTNPCGMVMRAINYSQKINAVGICDLPRNLIDNITSFLNAKQEKIFAEYFGLNHFGWINKVYHDGVDVTSNVIDNFEKIDASIDKEIVRIQGAIPISYLKYYYHPERFIKRDKPARARELMLLESEILKNIQSGDIGKIMELMNKRSVKWYKYIVEYIKALNDDNWSYHVLNVRNGTTLDFLPEDSIVEVGCLVRNGIIKPIPVRNVPKSVKAMIFQLDTYEDLAVKGILNNDHDTLIEALIIHPYIQSYNTAKSILKKILEGNRKLGF